MGAAGSPEQQGRSGTSPGDTLAGKYTIERVLGRGGMGVVVAARHLQLDDRVAIKFMHPEVSANAEGASRFLREARASAKVKSEHIVRVFDVGVADGVHYLVMEYLEGETLAALLRQRRQLPPGEAVSLVLQACDAIAEAHARGIVHRDLKPENLFVTRRTNGTLCLKVLDFGISKIMESNELHRMTGASALMGSPSYMSPEQLSTPRDVDARSDLWSLGIVLYELVSGEVPFLAETLPQLCTQIMHTPHGPLGPPCPPELAAIVDRALEKHPGQRWPDVPAFAAALTPFARGAAAPPIGVESPVGERAATDHVRTELSSHVARASSPGRAIAIGIGALAGLLCVAIGGYTIKSRRPRIAPVGAAVMASSPVAQQEASNEPPAPSAPLTASAPVASVVPAPPPSGSASTARGPRVRPRAHGAPAGTGANAPATGELPAAPDDRK
jgi:eukaryotic-like serine/threonine-protein kinase